MKTTRYCFFMVLTCLAQRLPAQVDTFTYQGRLDANGGAFDGVVQMRLAIYDAASGGNLMEDREAAVTVNHGQFTFVFSGVRGWTFPTGANRWIEVAVDDPAAAGVDYVPLVPRQPVTATPFAMYADHCGSAASLSEPLNPSSLASGTVTGTVNFAPAAGAPFSVGSATRVDNLNADFLDGLHVTAFVKISGSTMTGSLVMASPASVDFGNSVRQMLNLWGTSYGIGVQTDTLYQRSNNDFAWYKGGVHNDGRDNSGGGTSLMLLNSSGILQLMPGVTQTTLGAVQLRFGDSKVATNQPYCGIGEADDDDDTMEVYAKRVRIKTINGVGGQNDGYGGIDFGQMVGETIRLWSDGTYGGGDDYGIGVQLGTEYFRTGAQFAWFKGGQHASGSSGIDPGSGGTTLMTLSSDGNLWTAGAVSATVLTIRGGADLAEPFPIAGNAELEEGSVVVIDETRPGKLRLSTSACDRRVAGVISGAGGVRPGLLLEQEGVIEGGQHVSLTGRVYVKADARGAPIEPGDMLTTSDLPGHAMKAVDLTAAQGAILGKAMSRLESGTGLVLVLVTLQ